MTGLEDRAVKVARRYPRTLAYVAVMSTISVALQLFGLFR